ncbi:hypothetical protein E4U21_004326 [Claviceps maximensis]|nr:hypothetical protein E4U21_004326 [Claviceps maximensis]
MAVVISAPDPARLLAPILPVLPVAAACAQPATQVLPLLSPILRQRVQLLSGSDPWLRLLCYDAAKAVRLAAIVCGPALEPHPVSGEVEIDWAYDAQTRYRRLDQETLQALVALPELGLAFRLVHCVHDKEGGDADGWRIGEVTVADKPLPFSQFGGSSTIAEAEQVYRNGVVSARTNRGPGALQREQVDNGGGQDCNTNTNNEHDHDDDDDDDDDDYWNLYDKTPANRSPAPQSSAARPDSSRPQHKPSSSTQEEEDAYFAQYAHVQPAMDNHDPDEQAHAEQLLDLPSSIQPTSQPNRQLSPQRTLSPKSQPKSKSESESESKFGFQPQPQAQPQYTPLQQPHPDSKSSSPTHDTIARLEHFAGQQTQNEYGVRQHISRSIRSLYLLAASSSIPVDDFSSLVRTELECLSMMDESG